MNKNQMYDEIATLQDALSAGEDFDHELSPAADDQRLSKLETQFHNSNIESAKQLKYLNGVLNDKSISPLLNYLAFLLKKNDFIGTRMGAKQHYNDLKLYPEVINFLVNHDLLNAPERMT